jgi:phospholipid-binding lipoprotein MlaA
MPSHSFRNTLSACCLICGLGGGLALGGCATAPSGGEEDQYAANDPLESVNRKIFAFNQAFDRYLLKPVAIGYRDTLPDPVRNGVRNFLQNMRTPVVLLNDVLQGQVKLADNTLGRFVINTTFGVGGVMDIAADHGLPYHDADFGQTLGVWGSPAGPYLMLPILGPSNPRDTVGYAADSFSNPLFFYLNGEGFDYIPYVTTATGTVDWRSRNIGLLDKIEATSLDYYAEIRSLYNQRREALIRHEKPPEAPAPGASGAPAP